MARKNKNEQSGLEQAGSFQPSRLRPIDVQQVEFRVSRKGYNETEVDEFLDRITEELVALTEENKHLKEGGAPVLGLSDTPEEAQEIIRQARVEADAILAAARATAATTGGGDPVAAVYPFLTKEREFLSALGEMVRAHMEGIKSDARALQAAASAQPPAPAPPAPAAAPADTAPADTAPAGDAAVEGSAWAATAAAPPEPEPEPAPEPEAAPEVASIPPSDVDTPKKKEGEEPSLRDLFWGDE